MKVTKIKANGDTTQHDVSTFLEIRELVATNAINASYINTMRHPTDSDLVIFYKENMQNKVYPKNAVFPELRGAVVTAPFHFDKEVTWGYKMYHVNNIQWDTDNEEVDLPNEQVIECEFEDDIADTLSDLYGWCISGFRIERVEILAHKH